MDISPDQHIFWQKGFFHINETLVATWCIIFVMALGAKLVTRKIKSDIAISRWQAMLEIIVTSIAKQIEEVGLKNPKKYLGFLGTLFLFVAVSSLFTILPGYTPPTGSLSTTVALAL